jgi:ABC-type antimicrobial peptide transport system permease subunit
VLSLILWQGAKLALIGVFLGAGMAAGLTRFMRALLFDVSPTDAVTFLGAGLLLTIVALTACMIPACRAASVDPMQALRNE